MGKKSLMIFGISLTAVLAALPARSGSADCDQAKQLVEKFLKLDANVGRLSTDDYKKHFDDMIVYKIDGKVVHEEPAWDMLTAIRSYKVTGCQAAPDGFRVSVQYDSIGDLSHGVSEGQCPLFQAKKSGSDTQDFEIMKVKKDLKIRSAPGPHVSMERAEKWIEKGSKGCSKEKEAALKGLKAKK